MMLSARIAVPKPIASPIMRALFLSRRGEARASKHLYESPIFLGMRLRVCAPPPPPPRDLLFGVSPPRACRLF